MKRIALGYVKIIIPSKHKGIAMNAILINNLRYRRTKLLEDGSLEIIIKASSRDLFQSVFEDNSIESVFSKNLGFCAYIWRYHHRFGLLFGAFIMLLCVYVSSLFVWRIDIEGNKTVSNEEIIKTLNKSGFSLGSFIPTVDYDELHNKFLLNSSKVSWISVNIKGNVATVLVKERMIENEKPKTTSTNVIASSDAQILTIQLYEGKKVVNIGDIVKKGDLLISGIINSQSQGTRYVHADGVINGYVKKHISVKIPLNSTEKHYTGSSYKEKSLKIFSKSINFSPKYRNSYIIYDKIEKRKRVCIFGRIELPLEFSTVEYREYEEIPISYSYDQAVDMAFSELRVKLDEALMNAELISKSISTRRDESGFYLDCELYCIENIATLVEFEVKQDVN